MKLQACLLCAVMLVAGSPVLAGAAVPKAKSSARVSVKSDKRSNRTGPISELRRARHSLRSSYTQHRAVHHGRQAAHHNKHSRARKGHLG
jgi:hypothetical protein